MNVRERFSPFFIRGTAICAFLSALTTLGVHLLPLLHPTQTFEEQVQLAKNPIYVFRLWVVLIHILLVLASMWGVAAKRYRVSAGLLGLGLGGYWIFGLAELFRVSLTLNAVNGWRSRYLMEKDPAVQQFLRQELLSWPQINDALFFLLVLGFLLGNLFYSFALRKGTGLEKWVSVLLLLWAGLSFTTLLHEFLGQAWLDFIPEFLSYTFQPFVRIMIGVWLWRVASAPPENIVSRSESL
jgi:hypothetical protein